MKLVFAVLFEASSSTLETIFFNSREFSQTPTMSLNLTLNLLCKRGCYEGGREREEVVAALFDTLTRRESVAQQHVLVLGAESEQRRHFESLPS